MRNDGVILVTGSAGHLGEALVRTLRAAGRAVRGIDRLASPYTDVVGSIAEPDLVAACMDGVGAVLHTATLHKPHVATHTRQDFIDANITGTLNLLDAAAAARVGAFLFTSTTSTFGDALSPPAGAPAAWITEDVAPVAKNIYGVTKVAAEELCALAARNQGVPCLVLRTSRFFPEADDNPAARDAFADANLKANEYLHRRVDLEDVVGAHLCALERAGELPFGRYVITATTPFEPSDAAELRRDSQRGAGKDLKHADRKNHSTSKAPSLLRQRDSHRRVMTNRQSGKTRRNARHQVQRQNQHKQDREISHVFSQQHLPTPQRQKPVACRP